MGQFGLRAQKYTQRVPLGKRAAEPMKRVRLKRFTRPRRANMDEGHKNKASESRIKKGPVGTGPYQNHRNRVERRFLISV